MDVVESSGSPIKDVRDAIKIAKDYVRQVFSDEILSDVGLEETEYDPVSKSWRITIGFSRPWNTPASSTEQVLRDIGAVKRPSRSFKIVGIDHEGHVTAMKNRYENVLD